MDRESIVSLSRKRKKELRRLQNDANKLWESQQEVAGQAAQIARAAGRQLGTVTREDVLPAVHDSYERHVAPVVNRGVNASRKVVDKTIVPAVGASSAPRSRPGTSPTRSVARSPGCPATSSPCPPSAARALDRSSP
ncbi:hypothetical protein [Microbacterium sp. NIBRBAC000506063]|uniref:hypothetical protein n=1 Tax=Microbacterium sp. NIBRBAC000506063 TaxID=2734618 RepID=UPI002948C019|nr:hypothetical protein [Microbacterium sp. NIBRBAC000506063]